MAARREVMWRNHLRLPDLILIFFFMATITLYEFPVSHYCEKIRWALDYKNLPYQRVSLVPILHIPRMWALTRQTQVPVLQIGSRRISQSPHILATLEEYFLERPSLLPHDNEYCRKALELCADFDKHIGIHVRRLAYTHTLPDRAAMLELLSAEQSPRFTALLQPAIPLLSQAMHRGLGINDANYQKSLQIFDAAIDRLEQHMQSNGYLVGNEFSVADLTAAALLSPLVRPPGTLYAQMKHHTPAYLEFCNRYAQRPFFQWVLEIYRKHR
jgi:glutathione S-transferase